MRLHQFRGDDMTGWFCNQNDFLISFGMDSTAKLYDYEPADLSPEQLDDFYQNIPSTLGVINNEDSQE